MPGLGSTGSPPGRLPSCRFSADGPGSIAACSATTYARALRNCTLTSQARQFRAIPRSESLETLPRRLLCVCRTPKFWLRAGWWKTPRARILRCRRRVSEFWPAADRTAAAVAGCAGSRPHRHAELTALAESFPRGMLILDLETCGFAGSMVFLAGLGADEGGLVLEQLLAQKLCRGAGPARNPVAGGGTPSRVGHVQRQELRLADGARPQHAAPPGTRPAWHDPIAGRRTPPATKGLGRDDPRPELVHCDVLHHARRRWKHLLPDCRLQTLERHVCQRRRARRSARLARAGGVPRVCAARANRTVWARILRHNALDLVTLAQLACRLIADASAVNQPAARRA